MEISPISWQNHSTCPRLDMSGLAWKFNNFSKFSDRQWKLFFWGLVNTCFANCSSGSVTESARYSTFFKIKFLLLFMIFLHSNKFPIFPFLSCGGMERWMRHEYKVSIFIKSSLPRIFLSDQKQYHHLHCSFKKTRITFFRQPTRLLILFRCSFSPFPSLPARIPTLCKKIQLYLGFFQVSHIHTCISLLIKEIKHIYANIELNIEFRQII